MVLRFTQDKILRFHASNIKQEILQIQQVSLTMKKTFKISWICVFWVQLRLHKILINFYRWEKISQKSKKFEDSKDFKVVRSQKLDLRQK